MKFIVKTLFLFFLILNASYYFAYPQTFTSFGKGVNGPVTASCIEGNNLYVVYESNSYGLDSVEFTASTWNGTSWQHFPPFTIVFETTTIAYEILSVAIYNNEIYVAGNFPKISGVENSSNIIKYNGSNWTHVGNGIKPVSHWYFVTDMVVYRDQLYVAGLFNQAGNQNVSNIASWDGTQWSMVGNNEQEEGTSDLILDMEIIDSNLYIAGQFDTVASNPYGCLVYWDGNGWNSLSTPYLTVSKIMNIQNKLYVFGETDAGNKFKTYKSNKWSDINKNLATPQLYSMTTLGNTVWAAGDFSIDNKQFDVVKWDGLSWNPALRSSNYYNIDHLTNYHEQLVIMGNIDTIGSSNISHIAGYNEPSGIVSGYIFIDKNTNCLQEANENGLSNTLVEIQPGDIFVGTNNNGKFEQALEPGQYTIKYQNSNRSISPCSPDSYTVEVKADSIYDYLDFPTYSGYSDQYDLNVSITGFSGWRVRKGFSERYRIEFKNVSDNAIPDGSINLLHDPRLSFDSLQSTPGIYTKPHIKWDFRNLEAGEERAIIVSLKVPLNIKDSTVNIVYGLPDSKDFNIANNADTFYQWPVSSLDPNDKQCSPSGYITKKTKQIDYIIRFQNTGTDTAYRVRVIDTIDTEFLPITEIVLNSSSHHHNPPIIFKNTITWIFDNIMLVDSSRNAKESHGYIRYSAKIREGLAVGDTIENEAYIYFDYQKPVLTNKVLSIVYLTDTTTSPVPDSNLISVYPVPATQYIYIENNDPDENINISLINVLGQTVLNTELPAADISKINISEYMSGIYYLVCKNPEISKKILIIRDK